MKRSKRPLALGVSALAFGFLACSNEGARDAAVSAGQQVLSAALPTPAAEAQTPAKPRTKALPKGAYELQVVQIADPSGRMRTPVAGRALIPAGWKAEGGVIWPEAAVQECAEWATYAWAATSPDGMSTFELFPSELWSASNTTQGNCMYGEFQDVRSYLTAYVQRNVPGAANLQYRQRPELLEPQRPEIESTMQMINVQYAGLGTRFWPDAGELTFSYSHNGAPMKGVLGATARFYLTQNYNALGGPPLTTLVGQTNYTYAASFPASDFDPQLIELMRKSVKPDYTWLHNYSDFLLERARAKTGVVKQRADAIVAAGYALTQATIDRNRAAANAAVAKTYADAPIPSGAADDIAQRERIEAIRGVETYDDPLYGGQVQLDNTYDHAWRVQNADTYILTNDPNFNPGQYDINARQLQVSK